MIMTAFIVQMLEKDTPTIMETMYSYVGVRFWWCHWTESEDPAIKEQASDGLPRMYITTNGWCRITKHTPSVENQLADTSIILRRTEGTIIETLKKNAKWELMQRRKQLQRKRVILEQQLQLQRHIESINGNLWKLMTGTQDVEAGQSYNGLL